MTGAESFGSGDTEGIGVLFKEGNDEKPPCPATGEIKGCRGGAISLPPPANGAAAIAGAGTTGDETDGAIDGETAGSFVADGKDERMGADATTGVGATLAPATPEAILARKPPSALLFEASFARGFTETEGVATAECGIMSTKEAGTDVVGSMLLGCCM